MTAKEANDKANVFNSIKTDILYKKIEKLIKQAASKGQYQIFVNLSQEEIEWIYGSCNDVSTELRIKVTLEHLCSNGFNIEIKIYKRFGTKYEIKIDWSNGNATGSIKYI